jgi:hypothetical protein
MERLAENLFNVGDVVLWGKYKSKRGKIIDIGVDDRGVPYVTIEPIPKGRKSVKTLGLFNIWREDHLKFAPAKVAARYLESQAALPQWIEQDSAPQAEHYRVECPSCGVVVSQCRCAGPVKTVTHQLCGDCIGGR